MTTRIPDLPELSGARGIASAVAFWGSAQDRTFRATITELTNTFYPEDFGALGDGSTDDAPAIQAAIDAAGVAGGVVVFGPKVYVFASTLTFSSRGVTLQGAGRNTFASVRFGTVLLWSGSAAATWIEMNGDCCAIRDFDIRATGVQTAGVAIAIRQVSGGVVGTRNALDRVYVRECYNGINVHGMPYTTLTDVYVDNQRGTYGVRFYGDSTYRTDNLFLTRVVVETPYDVAGSAGFLMEGLCASVFATDCYFRDVAYGVHVRASGGNTPTFARFFRCAVEACLTNGYYLQGLSFGVVERSYIGINGLASGGGDGSGLVLGTDCSGCIQLIGNDVRGNGRHGYEIQASAAAVQIENLQHAANSQNANNTYDGVNVAGGTERFQIRGGYVGGSILMAGVATRQRYGVSIGAGCDYYIVQGVDARFNVTGAINDGGGSNKSVTGNLT